MKTRDFFFNLPEALIAQEPARTRGTSRLLVANRETGEFRHMSVGDLPGIIPQGTVIVLNNSRVRKARVFAASAESGGRVEFLFLEKTGPAAWKVLTSKQKKQKPGKSYLFPGNIRGTITECREELRIVELEQPLTENYFEQYGHVPLPPYIKRSGRQADTERYQTIYSRETGSAAAPTAGLHFTEELLARLRDNGCRIVHLTLHVGLGTFLPIRTENIEAHKMHEEHYSIPDETAAAVNEALRNHTNILAVGTTVVRTLESACRQGCVQAGAGKTDIYIYPGYQFRVVSSLLTNFHTPESTLLLLVSALAGAELIKTAYQEAIARQYRFFSYGDAMLIL